MPCVESKNIIGMEYIEREYGVIDGWLEPPEYIMMGICPYTGARMPMIELLGEQLMLVRSGLSLRKKRNIIMKLRRVKEGSEESKKESRISKIFKIIFGSKT